MVLEIIFFSMKKLSSITQNSKVASRSSLIFRPWLRLGLYPRALIKKLHFYFFKVYYYSLNVVIDEV